MEGKSYNDWIFNRFSGRDSKTKRFSGQNIKRFFGHLFHRIVGRHIDNAVFSVPLSNNCRVSTGPIGVTVMPNDKYSITYLYKEYDATEYHPAPVDDECPFCYPDEGYNVKDRYLDTDRYDVLGYSEEPNGIHSIKTNRRKYE